MGLLDGLKKAIGLGAAKPAAAPQLSEMQRLEQSSSIDAYVQTLRRKWLEKALWSNEQTDWFNKEFLPRMTQRFGGGAEGAALISIVRGAYYYQDAKYYSPELTRTANGLAGGPFALEGTLFLYRGALQIGHTSRGWAILMNALKRGGGGNELAAWEWRSALRGHGESIDKKIRVEGEGAMRETDKLGASMLGCHVMKKALDVTNGLGAERLGSAIYEKERDEIASWINGFIRSGEEACIYSLPSPAVFMRLQMAAGRAPGNPFDRMIDRVIEMRLQKTGKDFVRKETDAYRKHLSGIKGYFQSVKNEYADFFPALEYEAETALAEQKYSAAAGVYAHMLQARPYHGYYAYRAGEANEAAGARVDSSRYFLHASRSESSYWRDRLARVQSALRGYEFEARAINELPHEYRSEAAEALGTALGARFSEAWEMFFFMVTPQLGRRTAQLFHYAGDIALNEEAANRCFERARDYYFKAGNDDGFNAVGSRSAPEEVFDPIVVALGSGPV
ncbi:MAG TPA: hypothetical protein VKX17_16095 [Planctomycetota bacterium]|nr:hypothetical protein [Planctomycetota bacterium]